MGWIILGFIIGGIIGVSHLMSKTGQMEIEEADIEED